MFTGNYHRATWDNCEPIRGDFLFVCNFFFFQMLSHAELQRLTYAVNTKLHSAVMGSQVCPLTWTCAYVCLFCFSVSHLTPH